MDRMKFQIVMEQDEDGTYVAECPALPGCISQGKNQGGNPQEHQGRHSGLP